MLSCFLKASGARVYHLSSSNLLQIQKVLNRDKQNFGLFFREYVFVILQISYLPINEFPPTYQLQDVTLSIRFPFLSLFCLSTPHHTLLLNNAASPSPCLPFSRSLPHFMAVSPVILVVHLLSFIPAICPAPFHFCFASKYITISFKAACFLMFFKLFDWCKLLNDFVRYRFML